MRRPAVALIIAAGTLGVVAVGSRITAWASWPVESTTGRGSLTAAVLPAMEAPEATATSRVPRVGWTAVTFASGHPVGGYVVIRHIGTAQAEACRAPVSQLSCSDTGAKPGSKVTYTVQALAGTRWTGPASAASDVIHVPGKPAGPEPPRITSPGHAGLPTPADGQTSGGGTDHGNANRPAEQAEATAPTPSVSPSASATPAPTGTGTGIEGGGGGG